MDTEIYLSDRQASISWIWGAGDSGIEVYKARHLFFPSREFNASQQIVGFIDSNPALQGRTLFGLPIVSPEVFANNYKNKNNTRVVITPVKNESKAEIYNTLINMGMSKRFISFAVGGSYDPRFEYMRNFAEFVYDQGITGNVAECGVYRGYFAAKMNRSFYNRQLFLFDTFEGFDKRDIVMERNIGSESFLGSAFNKVGFFNNTSVTEVLAQMPFAENIVVRKGWIPESFDGVDEVFCFVNLDLDLYQPMLESFMYFWERMAQGGVILCHDYLAKALSGVKRAVQDFEQQLGRFIPKTTIGDGSTIAIIKD